MPAPSVSKGTNTAYRRRANLLRIRVARLRNLHPDDVLPSQVFDPDSTCAAERACPVLDDESGLVADALRQKSAANLRASQPEYQTAGKAPMSGCGGDSKANGDETSHPSPPKTRVASG